MDDLISRDYIKSLGGKCIAARDSKTHELLPISSIDALPSAQPEEIGYEQCANAMMKMWIDEVVTDGEYNRIMDKLNKHWRGKQDGKST